jgi:anti-sigma regulatory factor (Ser/Thr protein kinase)
MTIGVSEPYGASVPAEPFRHEALLYEGEDGFVVGCSEFVEAGRERGEPTLVVAGARKLDLLREALGSDAGGVLFADMASVGRNPARIIPAWQAFVDEHAAPGVRLRGIGEPISPERAPDELAECERHEALLNLAFAGATSFWLLCPYDVAALPYGVIERARRNHPFVDSRKSPEYLGLPRIRAPFERPLPEPAGDVAEIRFVDGPLEPLRRFVAERARQAGVERRRTLELVVAANEIVTNSLKHGGGGGVLRAWPEPSRFVCEIRDAGELGDPLADRRLPTPDEPRGRGLWLANQLCDLVQIRKVAGGLVVRLHVLR